MNRQMMLAEIPLNPSVRAKDELRLSKQAREVYEKLQTGPLTTGELSDIACQYNARLNEIRHTLQPLGLTVDLVKEGNNGNNEYAIVEFEGSNYQKHLQKRGLI